MGLIHSHRPVLGILAAFSRYADGLEWARQTAVSAWGPLALCSPVFDFVETKFYETTMGSNLKKQLLAFERLMDPGELVQRKHQANDWEAQYARESGWPEARPVNLDPGYLTEAKLILASTKDRDHRIYLDRGIFAEGTIFFRQGSWQTRPWTYPDYQRTDYHLFFSQCRDYLRGRYRDAPPP